MPIRRLFPLMPVVVLTASLAPGTSGQEPKPPQPVDNAEAQARTVDEMRNVGTAMFSWLVDQVNDDSSDLSTNPKSDKACVSSKSGSSECEIVQIDKLPIISYQDLTKLLVPRYIAAIPEKDAWDHPYDYRLDPKNTLGKCVMAIRSAGKDRKFSGNRYELGNFPPADADQDLVWMDGFFIRWPERKAEKEH